jgi:hypothetical protein
MKALNELGTKIVIGRKVKGGINRHNKHQIGIAFGPCLIPTRAIFEPRDIAIMTVPKVNRIPPQFP